jgi:hypothetical protein
MLEKRNAVPRTLFEKAKKQIEGEEFPWFYTCNTAYSNKDPEFNNLYNGSFGHVAMTDGRKNSVVADTLEDCLLTILDSLDKKVEKIHRIRVGFIPVCPHTNVNPPHVDVAYHHSVGLLYLNDSDGDTVIYNERYNPYDTLDTISYFNTKLKKQVTELTRLTPEENKFIMFDGMHYHSSSAPVLTKRRIAVNFVFEAYDRR